MAYFDIEENVERHELSIVIIGAFNPVIITPFWLSNKSIIRESDAQSAVVRIIHNEIVDYDLEWASINITQKRFELKCNKEPFFEIARDLVVGVFTILKETPITSLGINHNKLISLKNIERYYEFGNRLCPLNNWSSFMNDPRLQKLEIIERETKKKSPGSVLVTIYTIYDTTINFGAGININDHYDFTSDNKDVKRFAALFLLEEWDASLEIAKKVLSNLSNSLNL